MKEKVSLKRQTRRYKSESSSKEEHSCSNQHGKLMKDGKEICPIPLVKCLCPDQVVDREDPENSVKMLCSNRSCSFSSNAFVHMECFKALEEKMYIILKHLGHKTSNWTDTQIRQNLWDRKGLTLIQAQIRCPCNGGISLRDEEAWIRRENDIQKADKKRKAKKKKDLPSIVTRVRCEFEKAPPQYDSHTAESDDVTDPEIASQFLRCRLENGFSNKSKKSSKKPASPFKLEKSPEIEFPSIGEPHRPSSLSFCESDGMKVQSPTYNKVVSNGMGTNKNVKPVGRYGPSGFEMNNGSPDFAIGRNDFRRAPGAEKELRTPIREASGTPFREELGTPIRGRSELNLLSAAGVTAQMGFAALPDILGLSLTLTNLFSTSSPSVGNPNSESRESSMLSRSTPASTSSFNSDFIHPFLDSADPRQDRTANDEESKKSQDYNIFKDYQFFK